MEDIGKLQTEVQTMVDESSRTHNKADGNVEEATTREEPPVEQSEIATTKFMEKIEGLQDRWDAISQILEAQSQRVSFPNWSLIAIPVWFCVLFVRVIFLIC